MFNVKNIPNWMRAESLVACLVSQIRNMNEKEVDELFNNMLDHQTFRVDTELTQLGDKVRFYFQFTKNEAPEFLQSIGHFKDTETEDYLNVFHGIPYPALFAMNNNPDKKQVFINYITLIGDVLAWQTIILLNEFYKVHTKKQDIKDYNSAVIFSAYAGQICIILSRNNSFEEFLERAEKGRESFLEYLSGFPAEENYALSGICNFIKNITEKNYRKLIAYCKKQYAIKQDFAVREES